MSGLEEVHPVTILCILGMSGVMGTLIAGFLGGAIAAVLGLALYAMTVNDIKTERDT